MNIVLVTNGSRGDIHPFISIGIALKQRGHSVTLVSIDLYRALATESGLNFIASDDGEQYRKLINNPMVYRLGFRKMFALVAQIMLIQPLAPVFNILKTFDPKTTLVLALNNILSARIAQEKLGLPCITICLHPFSIWSIKEPCEINNHLDLKKIPLFIRKRLIPMFERLVIDRPLIGPVNDFRRQLGLKTVKHIYSRWIYSPEQVLCLFPNWFAKPAADWPQNTKLMGFLHYDEDPEAQLPADVIDFLAAGQKPILITNSTAITQATEFFGQAIDALRALGLPCIVLTPHSSNITRTLNPERELYVPYLPHKKLLPHCRAIIHSGTIGSSVLALSCELPQLLMPMYYDQFDNCARLKKMEVALTLPRKKWTAKNISIALQRLLSSKDIQLNCKKFAEKVDFQQAGKDLCDHIETKISTLNV